MSVDLGKPAMKPTGAEAKPSSGENGFPRNWKQAIPCLVASRFAIIQSEAKDAVSPVIGKIISLIIAALCVFLAWLLVIAGAVGAIAANSSWQWYQAAFAIAGGHLLVALIALLLSRSKSVEKFPITRAEFEKDREWLNQLTNK